MPNLNITEFVYKTNNANNVSLSAATAPSNAIQNVAIGSSSVASALFAASTGLLRLSADTTCAVQIGVNPVATALTMRLVANQTEYIGVPAGVDMSIAVIVVA
jgi:hypothetical protein